MVSLVRVLKNGLRCPVAKSQLNSPVTRRRFAFHDGPHPEVTPRVLDPLWRYPAGRVANSPLSLFAERDPG
jgi:hypothetical protein